jgi:hypothetical protein
MGGDQPGGETEASPDTAMASPDGLDASPDAAASPDAGASPDGLDASPDAAASPDAGASPDVAARSPDATADPAGEASVSALAVVDHAGSRTILEDGRCQLTQPDAAGETPAETIAGQPTDGSTLRLQFGGEPGTDTGTDPGNQSLELTIELSRGFAVEEPAEEPAEESPSPDLASPSPEGPPLISGEDILPFTVLPEQVQLSVQLATQDQAAQPEVMAGSVAPNGVNGYLIARTDDGELLTINFVCAEPEDEMDGPDMGEPGASPDASPGADESPAIEPSPSP